MTPGGASRLAALLIAHLCPISSLFAPCQPGAALRDVGANHTGGTVAAIGHTSGNAQDAELYFVKKLRSLHGLSGGEIEFETSAKFQGVTVTVTSSSVVAGPSSARARRT